MAGYCTDWTGQFHGQALAVVKPRTTEEVAAVLQAAHQYGFVVVPQGGNTGLVGGSVPSAHHAKPQVVLSMQGMAEVEHIDPDAGVVTVQAGAILSQVNAALQEHGLAMPIDLGAKDSCTIGGNIATGAGGIHFVAHGPLRGAVLGVEAVLPNGQVLDLMSQVRKSNTGPDLRALLVGSEGTLAVVTRATIAAVPARRAVATAVLAARDYAAVARIASLAQQAAPEFLYAVEWWDAPGVAGLHPSERVDESGHVLERVRQATQAGAFLLLELAGSNEAWVNEALQGICERALELGQAADVIMPASHTQREALWAAREGITAACSRRGHVWKYDLSCHSHNDIPALVAAVRYRLTAAGCALSDALDMSARGEKGIAVLGYGHVADLNLHLNVVAPPNATGAELAQVAAALEPWVYDSIIARRGSVSAEHGVGQLKLRAAAKQRGAVANATMAKIKAALDPGGVLNPGKVLVTSRGSGPEHGMP